MAHIDDAALLDSKEPPMPATAEPIPIAAATEAAAIEAVADVRAGRITMDEARARMRQIAEAIAKEMLDSIYGRP